MADEPKSIRDSIEEALGEVPDDDVQEAPARPAARPAPAPEDERDELSEGIEERPRDPATGRFLPKQDELPEAETEKPRRKQEQEPQAEGEPKPETPAVQEPPKEAETREQRLAKLTKNWRAEHREFLAQQPPEVQDFLAQRQSEMDQAYNRKSQEIAYLRNEYGPIDQMFQPEMAQIKAAGYTPRMLIEGWAQAERALLHSSESAAVTLRNIAEGYKVPREIVAQAFGFDPRTPQEIQHLLVTGGGPPPTSGQEVIPPATNGNGVQFRDPRVDELLAERRELHERAVIDQNMRFRQAQGAAQAQINAFKEATDDQGRLLHPFFQEVEGHMTALARFAGENTGRIPPLKELYDSAVQANPATRAKLLAASQRAQSEKQRQLDAARGKAVQARKAASSVVGSGGRPANRTLEKALPKGASIRASIDAALEQHGDQE